MSDGVFQTATSGLWITSAEVESYSQFPEEHIRAVLTDLMSRDARRSPNTVLYTGGGGREAFNRALAGEGAGFTTENHLDVLYPEEERKERLQMERDLETGESLKVINKNMKGYW